MSITIDTMLKHRRMWYIYHSLAALSGLLLITMVIGLLFLIRPNPQAAAHNFFFSPVTANLFRNVAPVLGVCLFSAFGLWVGMLRHYFANRAVVARVWLFWLIACNLGAAIAYFLVVWRPSLKNAST
jgi:hypothetical protein